VLGNLILIEDEQQTNLEAPSISATMFKLRIRANPNMTHSGSTLSRFDLQRQSILFKYICTFLGC
jgi:hypothetical protein